MRKTSTGKMKRSFTIHDAKHVDGCPTKFSRKDYTGTYTGNQPVAAAKKAFTNLCSVKKIRGKCTLLVTVRETTQGSAGKAWSYKVKRDKLDQPGPFGNEYVNVAKSAKSHPKCKKSHKSSGRMRKHRAKSSTKRTQKK